MIVNTSVKYNSKFLKSDINSLMLHYPFIKLITIGYSILEKPLYCLKLGNGSKEVLYVATTHANEWITSLVLMKFIEDICNAYNKNLDLYGYNVRNVLTNTSVYIVPMVNPDGVDLVNGNINLNSNEYIYAKYISNQYPNIPFPNGWKANINGESLINFHLFYKLYLLCILSIFPLIPSIYYIFFNLFYRIIYIFRSLFIINVFSIYFPNYIT